MREVDFNHSVYMKCVDIATGLYYGSLMCNHYTDQSATYNNRQNNIGYMVYPYQVYKTVPSRCFIAHPRLIPLYPHRSPCAAIGNESMDFT